MRLPNDMYQAIKEDVIHMAAGYGLELGMSADAIIERLTQMHGSTVATAAVEQMREEGSWDERPI